MTWYILEGDPHRDMETLWWMHGYHNQYTLCQGGIWMKKWNQITAIKSSILCAPLSGFEQIDLRNTAYSSALDNRLDRFKVEFDVLDDNHKHRPAPTDIGNYFFLPDRGYYLTGYADNPAGYPAGGYYKMEMKLMGAEGFYWTSTAITDYVKNGQNQRHAYALEINNRNTIPYICLKYNEGTNDPCTRRWGFIAGYRPYTDPAEPWFQ